MSVVSSVSQTHLDADTCDALVELLEKEGPGGRAFGRLQRSFLLALQIVAYALPTLLAVWAVGVLAAGGWLERIGTWLPTLIVPLLLLLPIVLALNFPLLLGAWRQFRLARRLGPLKQLESYWEARSRSGSSTERRRRQRVLRWGVRVLVTLPPAVLLVLAIRSASEATGVPLLQRLWVYFVTALLPLAVLALSVVLTRLETRLSHFQEARTLKRHLRSEVGLIESENAIDLAPEIVSRLAALESASRLRGHAQAIEHEHRSPSRSYSVSRAPAAFEAIAALPADDRRRVEDAIDELNRRPASEGTIQVPETSFTLRFSIDHAAREIHVRDLIRQDADD